VIFLVPEWLLAFQTGIITGISNLVQKLMDNFPPVNNCIPRTPAAPGMELSKDESSKLLGKEDAFRYRSLLATCMHMQQWSRPDILQPT
jgi:hypothetical protein